MRRRKFFLSTLAVFLGLLLVGGWVLFLSGRFSIVADFLLPSKEGEGERLVGDDLLNRSYFENLKVEEGKVKVAAYSASPELKELSSEQVEVEKSLVLGASSSDFKTKKRYYLVLNVKNKSDSYIAPLEIKLTRAEEDKNVDFYSLYYPQLEKDGPSRYILISEIAPQETKSVPLYIVGLDTTEIENLSGNIVAYGNVLPFSLEEKYQEVDCTSTDCILNSEAFVAVLYKDSSRYLQDLNWNFQPAFDLPERSEVGLRLKNTDGNSVSITPFVGRVEEGIWYLPINIFSSEKANISGVFLADQRVSGQGAEIVKIRYPKDYPALPFVWDRDKLKEIKFKGPGQSCGLLSTYRCDKYNFHLFTKSSAFAGEVNLKSRLLALHQVVVGFGSEAKKYQKVALVPYLRSTSASDNSRLINGCDISLISNEEALGKSFLFYPRKEEFLHQIAYLLRHFDSDSERIQVIDENKFYEGDYNFYGIKDYKGLLWTEFVVPSQSRSYRLNLDWAGFDKKSKIIVQARSLVGEEFTDWATFNTDVASFDIAAGTEKVQLRIFFQGESPDLFGSLQSVELASAGSGGEGGVIQVPQPGSQASEEESGILGGRSLISTGTHLLLLLIISVILVVSIVYIVALIKEE